MFSDHSPVEAQDEIEQWREGRMPLFATTASRAKSRIFFSVETLCNILSEASTWRLCDDPAFLERNCSLIVGETETAKLHKSAIDLWDGIPPDLREQLFSDADALVFRSMAAHGLSQD